jgi:hypothetical protein
MAQKGYLLYSGSVLAWVTLRLVTFGRTRVLEVVSNCQGSLFRGEISPANSEPKMVPFCCQPSLTVGLSLWTMRGKRLLLSVQQIAFLDLKRTRSVDVSC